MGNRFAWRIGSRGVSAETGELCIPTLWGELQLSSLSQIVGSGVRWRTQCVLDPLKESFIWSATQLRFAQGQQLMTHNSLILLDEIQIGFILSQHNCYTSLSSARYFQFIIQVESPSVVFPKISFPLEKMAKRHYSSNAHSSAPLSAWNPRENLQRTHRTQNIDFKLVNAVYII